MDYQVNTINRLMAQAANDRYWEIDPETGYMFNNGKILEMGTPESEARIQDIVKDHELVLVTKNNWFDEGFENTHLIFATKRARERVFRTLDHKAVSWFFIDKLFFEDMEANPEHYRVLSVSNY
jgi:hypothetical protein